MELSQVLDPHDINAPVPCQGVCPLGKGKAQGARTCIFPFVSFQVGLKQRSAIGWDLKQG